MEGKIGLIFNGVWSQYAMASSPKYRSLYELLYVHEFESNRLNKIDALVIPFQSNQEALSKHRKVLYDFLAKGKKIAVFGDSTPKWIEANWEDRPVNNYWWVSEPNNPPIAHTDQTHPVFKSLAPRHACWHVHGVYTKTPEHAEIIQRNAEGETITWQTTHYGGVLFVSTLDPIVEHGIQQIRHLDNFVDSLTEWLCGVRPTGSFQIVPDHYGVGEFRW